MRRSGAAATPVAAERISGHAELAARASTSMGTQFSILARAALGEDVEQHRTVSNNVDSV
jgi:hypothetical protein